MPLLALWAIAAHGLRDPILEAVLSGGREHMHIHRLAGVAGFNLACICAASAYPGRHIEVCNLKKYMLAGCIWLPCQMPATAEYRVDSRPQWLAAAAARRPTPARERTAPNRSSPR